MTSPAMLVEKWSHRLAILKAVFLMFLIFLVTIVIVQLVRMSPCRDGHLTEGQPGWEENMMEDTGGRRAERDLTSFEAMLNDNPKLTSGQRKHRKHKHQKSRDKKRKLRSRRSNNGIRGRLREIQQMVRENQRQIANVNRTTLANLNGIRNDLGNILMDERVAVHLTYTQASDSSLVYNEVFFVWTLGESSPGYNFFYYRRAPSQEEGRDIYGVQIRFPGQYLLYSQVLINGRNTIQYMPHDCGHETVLYRRHAFRRKLLKSYITQHNRGLPFGSDASGNDGDPAIRPKDTSFQMGIFYLQELDEIRIQIPDTCNIFRYEGDPHGSYFGLMRL